MFHQRHRSLANQQLVRSSRLNISEMPVSSGSRGRRGCAPSFRPQKHVEKEGYAGVDLEPDFLGVSRTPKLENLGVRQKIWESAIFLKYDWLSKNLPITGRVRYAIFAYSINKDVGRHSSNLATTAGFLSETQTIITLE